MRAIRDYGMIEEGDHVAVGLSGGKDSWTLLHLLHEIRSKAPHPFRITAVTIDYGNENFDSERISGYLKEKNWDFHLEKTRNAQVIEEHLDPGSNLCSFCARLRRGKLYEAAGKIGANKIALGHHGDDLTETLLLNFFFSGKLRAMAPKVSNKKFTLIRPLLNCLERDIARYAQENDYPVIPCGCPHGCREAEPNRKRIKRMIELFEEEAAPNLRATMITALKNLQPSHLLDRSFFD